MTSREGLQPKWMMSSKLGNAELSIVWYKSGYHSITLSDPIIRLRYSASMNSPAVPPPLPGMQRRAEDCRAYRFTAQVPRNI
jgi:hypothetical protein